MLNSLLTRYQDSLKVLAAPSHPDVRERISPLLISKVLRTLRTMYDYVVVDTAPAFDEQTLTALDETDECIIVATLDVPTLKNVKVALDTLEMLNIGRGHRYLLLNRADDAVGIGAEKVETILGMNVAVPDLDVHRHRRRHQRRHADHRGQPQPPVERGVPQPARPCSSGEPQGAVDDGRRPPRGRRQRPLRQALPDQEVTS